MIYLDHAATTSLRPSAIQAMAPWNSGELWGNASSMHGHGSRVRKILEDCRESIASLIHCRARDIIFTSGATEANALALRGFSLAHQHKAGLAASVLEHSSVIENVEALEQEGVEVRWIQPDAQGALGVAQVADAISDQTKLVVAMLANNEIGHVTDIRSLSEFCETRGLQLHTDATQALGHMEVNFESLGVDTMSFSSHKVGGPQGVGVLVARRQARLASVQKGGTQELGRRAGTENMAGIVGLRAALEESVQELRTREKQWLQLRTLLEDEFKEIGGIVFNSSDSDRLPHLVNVSFEGIQGEALLIRLDMEGVCVSSGSACHADNPEPSHVLKVLGRSRKLAAATLRFSFGPETTKEEINKTAQIVKKLVRELRG